MWMHWYRGLKSIRTVSFSRTLSAMSGDVSNNVAQAKRPRSRSCRSLTPSSIGPLILASATLLSFLLRAVHLLPRASIASSAPLPTARLALRASYIHALSERVTDSRMPLRDEGMEVSMKEAKG